MEYLLISSRNVSRSSTESSYVKTYPSTTDNPEQTNNNLNKVELLVNIPDEQDVVIIAHINESKKGQNDNCCSIVSDVIERIPFYSFILRKSPYFSKKLQTLLRSNNEDFTKGNITSKTPIPINIHVPSLDSLYAVLNYLYNGKFNAVNIEPIIQVEIYILTMILYLDDLRYKVIKRLNSPVSCDHLVKLALAAEQYNDDPLLDDCISLISNFGYKVFLDKLYLNLGIKGFRKLICSDNLQMDELQIYAFTVLYMKSHDFLNNPYDQSVTKFSDMEMDIIKCIRYCAMSHDIISKIRSPSLDKLLLDAIIRLSTNTTFPLRVTAWKENKYFRCVCHTGKYPTVLIKLAPKQYASIIQNDVKIPPYHFSSHSSYNSNIMLPPIYLQDDNQYTSSNISIEKPYYTFTIGSYRVVSECSWVFEICRSRDGNLHIGFIFQHNESSLYRNKPTNDPFINDNVIYYDTANFSFNSALVDMEKCKILKNHVHLTGKFKPLQNNKLCQGDRIYIDVKCLSHCLNMTININENASESFSYPYKTMYTSGNVIKRPVINVAPYIAMLDYGDAICIPEVK
ncbi:conserved Plasmodium protein, unknown function [Babesia microti strain RI]|uniref:BTB domain-containing protein n=1 Tax=Babesia microti (strain RI) TaxID=1133968 RepID=A0A1N6LXI4_BABMR|nr:conserved Plasmodium protein, unknown function [Babesia microti strain RI]SIO73577.1 conserved Plasmodium protein, unknown function [Babesia microti strain RI]|eukprot:XP_021337664.1 conserved Plasmodium protein, unknown function [Babesia microti strain RI]